MNWLYGFLGFVYCGLVGYTKLRIHLNNLVRKFSSKGKYEKRRKVVGVCFLGVTAVNLLNNMFAQRIDWFGATSLTLQTAMILFWVYSAEHYTRIVEDQQYYFEGEPYSSLYNKYSVWMGKGNPPKIAILYYVIWVITVSVLVIFSYILGILRASSIIQIINGLLLMIILILSGNSVFSTIVFTFFLCDIYQSEAKAIKKGYTLDDKNKRLKYNEFMPSQTLGVQKLLADAQSHSTAFLFFALCYVTNYNLNIRASHATNLLSEKYFQVIVVIMLIICFGMYAICTIGGRFFLRQLVFLWKLEVKAKCEVMVEKLSSESSEENNRLLSFLQIRYNSLEQDRISLVPTPLELIITTLLGLVSEFIRVFI